MQIDIDLNNKLIEKAKALSNAKSKKEVVHSALKNYIKLLQRKRLISLKGNVKWEGDLKQMRKA